MRSSGPDVFGDERPGGRGALHGFAPRPEYSAARLAADRIFPELSQWWGVFERLGIPDEEVLICGMAIGYEDTSKPENNLRTERAPLEEWAKFFTE